MTHHHHSLLSGILILLVGVMPNSVGWASTFPVTDASQTLCYDAQGGTVDCDGASFSGQDGFYNFLPQSFCDHNDDTVTDLNTGLMWTKKNYGVMSITAAMESFSLAGYDDWRLPTITELYSLIDFDGYTGISEMDNIPYVNTAYFEVVYGPDGDRFIDGQLWSATKYLDTVIDGDECYFGLNLIDGRIKCYPISDKGSMADNENYVRYVRGSTAIGVNSFSAANDIVTDSATGLEWMQQDSGFYNAGDGMGNMNWIDALQYCEDLELGGKDDWRLPDAHELQSIVDYTRSPDSTSSAAINAIFGATSFTNEAGHTDYAYYWTGTTHLDGEFNTGSRAVYVAFGRALGNYTGVPNGTPYIQDVHGAGAQRSDPKSGTNMFPEGFGPQGDITRILNKVRCVRGQSTAASGIEACEDECSFFFIKCWWPLFGK